MAETTRALLSRLEARLAAQEAELSAFRAERAAVRRRPRRRNRLLPALAAAILVALVPLALLAAGPFTDLDPNSPHNGNIAAIQAAGITKGCDPPDFTQYCPKDNVTREEMASFLARTAGLGGNPPVANAATLQGYAASGLTRVGVGLQQADPISTTGTNLKTVAEVTLTTPGPGYVLLNGVIEVILTAGGPGLQHTQLVDVTENHVSPDFSSHTQGPRVEQSPTYLFPVTTAGPHTYRLQFRAGKDADTLYAFNGVITALYVPFGPTGNTP